LRIALVTTFYPPHNFGGDGRYVESLAQALVRRGCDVEIIYSADGWRVLSGSAPEPAEPPAMPGITVHRLRSQWPMAATLLTQQTGYPVMHGRALQQLLSRDFDLIHYHNISLVGGPGILTMGDAPKFYTAHEHWLVCANHVLWRHDRELCDAKQCVKCSIMHNRPPQLWRATGLLERAARHVDEFIALSESVAANHRAFGFTRDMHLMASFMPPSESVARVARPAHPKPYFLLVGRLEQIKGMQDVIPLFDADMPADLLIAGSGPYEPELRALAEGKPNVHFLGKVDPSALPDLYRESVALITPSICYEVFPMVALEAFRERTPIVARDLGPYPQIVRESGAGLIFNDGPSLRAALLRLAGDPALRGAMGESGASALEQRWSERVAMNDYFELLRKTAERKGRDDIVGRVDAMAMAL
jgi:glycosyltransferase involved in cell wall biosynthesis